MFRRASAPQGGSYLETLGVDAGSGDVLDAFQSASSDLARFKTVPEIAEASLRLALALTRSTVAFLALEGEGGGGRRHVFSMASDPMQRLPEDEIERIFAAASAVAAPTANATWSGVTDTSSPVIRSTCAQALQAAGQTLGMFGVASPTGHTAVQQRTFAAFANQVAAALALAQLDERRKEMVDALVNLRADLDRSERQRLINEERALSAERVEQAHDASVNALLAISRHARTGHDLADFYRRLTRSIAELVIAPRVLFWQLSDEGMLIPLAGAHGIDDEFLGRLHPVASGPDQDDVASRVVFHDLMFRAARSDEGAAGTIAVYRTESVHIHAVGTAVGRVRAAVAGFRHDLFGFDGLRQAGFGSVGLVPEGSKHVWRGSKHTPERSKHTPGASKHGRRASKPMPEASKHVPGASKHGNGASKHEPQS